MRMDMNITNEPLDVSSDGFIEQLDERVGAGVGNKEVNVTHVVNNNGGGHVHIAPTDGGTALDVDDGRIKQETFVLNMDGLRVEMVADISGVMRSLLFHARSTALTRDDVQKAYDLVYNIADGHDAVSEHDIPVLELVDKNDFFESDADDVDEVSPVNESASEYDANPSAYDALLGTNAVPVVSQATSPQDATHATTMSTNDDASGAHADAQTGGIIGTGDGKDGYDGIPSDILGMLLGNEGKGSDHGMGVREEQRSNDAVDGDVTKHEPTSPDVTDMQRAVSELIQQLDKTSDATKAEVERLRGQLTNQYVVNERLRKSLNAETDDKVRLQGEATRHAEEVAQHEAKEHSLQEALSSAIGERDDARRQLDEANDRYERLSAETAGKLGSLNDVLAVVRTQLSSEKGKTAEQQASIGQLGDVISGHESTIDELRSKLQRAVEEMQSMEESIGNLRKQANEERESAMAAKADANRSLKEFADKMLAKLKERQAKYDEDTASLEEQITSLTKLLDDVTTDRDSIRKQVTTLSRNSIAMKDRLAKAEKRADDAEAGLKEALAKSERHAKAESEYEDAIAHERERADNAQASARMMTEFAALKYAEAIRTRNECEEIANVMRDAMESDDADVIGLRERIALVLRRIDASKEDDVPVSRDATNDAAPDMHDMDDATSSEGKPAEQADDNADENVGTIGGVDAHEEQSIEFDDDYSFPSDDVMDGLEDDVIADDELDGTPLANTGSVDGELLMDVMEIDDYGDESATADASE